MIQKPNRTPRPPAWMLTYSDLVTLLLTFFVLLLSMSNMDETRFAQVRRSMEKAFSWQSKAPLESLTVPVPPITPQGGAMPTAPTLAGRYYKGIRNELRLVGLDAKVEAVQRDHGTLILRIEESVLFAQSSTQLKPESYPIVRKIAEMIRPLPLFLRIEGHSSIGEAASLSMSAWDLSVARAVSVMSFYHSNELLPQERMAASGYGASRPLANADDGQTSQGASAQKNQRVEFLLQTGPFSGTAEPTGAELPF